MEKQLHRLMSNKMRYFKFSYSAMIELSLELLQHLS